MKPRNMSFAMTQRQIIDRWKTVTRRDGWLFVRPGDLLRPVDRVMGFRKGERPQPLLPERWLIEVVAVRREPLEAITPDDVSREGFPGMTPAEFVTLYRRHGDKSKDRKVARIEFNYVEIIP